MKVSQENSLMKSTFTFWNNTSISRRRICSDVTHPKNINLSKLEHRTQKKDLNPIEKI